MNTIALNPQSAFETLADELLNELYDLIQKLHEVDFRDQNLIEECQKLSAKYQEVLGRLPEAAQDLRKNFEGVSDRLRDHSFLLNSKAKMEEVKQNWKRIAESYEETMRELKKKQIALSVEHTHVKPINYFRNAYHIGNAVAIYTLYSFVFSHSVGLSIMATLSIVAVTCEIVRKFHPGFNNFMVHKVFGKVSRPEEVFRVNSATYYLITVTAMMALAPAPAFLMALLALGFGDPIANILGKNFGTLKIYKQKSYIGCAGFFLATFAVCFLAARFHLLPQWSTGQTVALTASVALVGTVVELFSEKLDDNMTILLGCTIAAWPFV